MERGGMRVNVKGAIGQKTTCALCSGNFIYYFSHWHYWIIDDHVDVNWHYDTADCNKYVYWNKQPYSVHFRRLAVFSDKIVKQDMASVLPVFSRSVIIS